jgi:hypothetical protein
VLLTSLVLMSFHRGVHVAADHVGQRFQPVKPPDARIHVDDVLGARAPQRLDARVPVTLEPGSAIEHEDFLGRHVSDASADRLLTVLEGVTRLEEQ